MFHITKKFALVAAVVGCLPAMAHADLTVDGGNSPYTITANGSYGYLEAGNTGQGTINQTTNTVTVTGDLILGYQSTGTGIYNIGGSGVINTVAMAVGYGGNGTVYQTGGTVNDTVNYVAIGQNSGSVGNYNLSAGIFAPVYLVVGDIGTGTMTVTGGTTNTYGIYMSYRGGSGTFNFTAASTVNAGVLSVGETGTSVVNQSAGTFNVTGMAALGDTTGGKGTYNLSGGTLIANYITTNAGGQGTFNFNGGTLSPNASLTTFMGGLNTANVQTGGALINTAGFNVTISQRLLHDTTGGAPAQDGGLTKSGAGVLSLSGVNTYDGATTITQGTVTAGVADAFNHASRLVLNTGSGSVAAFGTGGFNETLADLTVSSAGVIDMGNGASILHFAASGGDAWNGTLSVWNWSGTPLTGGGADQIFFGSDVTGLTALQLADIRFYSDSGVTALGPAVFASGLNGEVVPLSLSAVPEPASLSLLLLGGVAALRRRTKRRE